MSRQPRNNIDQRTPTVRRRQLRRERRLTVVDLSAITLVVAAVLAINEL
jgi:hypothetical protein